MDIVEILKSKPIGTSLYSPLCGECTLREIKKGISTRDANGAPFTFNNDGNYCYKGD